MKPKVFSVLLHCIILSSSIESAAQQFPLYTQYIFDPYLINPSLLANTRKSEVNLLYRQQWTGIVDGPKTLQFDLQHAINRRMGFGVNVFNDKTILLSSTSMMATIGYRVPLASEHILGFGLSGGFFSNRIRTEEIPDIDINDPTILGSKTNNFSIDGQFGVNYSFRNLVLGFSLIRLVEHKTFSVDELQDIKFSELKNKIVFAGYKFSISQNFRFQTNFSYRFTSDNLNFFETSGVFSYNDIISVGGGYRENFGPTAIVRVRVKDLQIGFAYDLPSTKASVSTGGTNEIQLKWRFGKALDKLTKREKTPKEPDQQLANTENQVPIEVQTPIKAEEIPVVKEESAIIPGEVVTIKETEKPIEEAKVPIVNKENPVKPNEYHLIAGTFNRKANADQLIKDLAKNGITGELLHAPGDNYYYVYIPKYKTDTVTIDKVLEIRKLEVFKGAWFKKVDK